MALETYNITMPRTVYSGKDALKNLQTVVAGAKKVAVFTDKGILSTGLVDLPLAQLKEAGVETLVISDLPPEPTYGQVQKLVDEFKASGADFIVAVGGGSAMDTAKLASLLATEDYTVKDLLDNPGLAVKTVKTCLIPTTAVHALSYPLGGKYHIAHGVSNAILLVPVMKFNEPAIRSKLAAAYDRIVHGEKNCTTEEGKSAWVVQRMGDIVKHLDIPTSLAEFNVSLDDLDGLVDASVAFFAPFAFVYQPGILMEGGILQIVHDAGILALGTSMLVFAVAGYLLTNIPMWQRLLLVVGGICTCIPETITDFVGLGIGIFIVVLQILARQKYPKEHPELANAVKTVKHVEADTSKVNLDEE